MHFHQAFHNRNPFRKQVQDIIIDISQDGKSVGFTKQSVFALVDGDNVWENDCLNLNGIKYSYNRPHSIESNTELKSYLSKFLILHDVLPQGAIVREVIGGIQSYDKDEYEELLKI